MWLVVAVETVIHSKARPEVGSVGCAIMSSPVLYFLDSFLSIILFIMFFILFDH